MGLLASIAGTAWHLVGGHLLSGGGIGKAEGITFAIGGRFFAGAILAFYVQNGEFRRGADICIEAIAGALGSGAFDALKAGFNALISLF